MNKAALWCIAVMCVSARGLLCQEFIDVRSLPRPDCNGDSLFRVFERQTKILVIPDSVADSSDFALYLDYFKRGWDARSIKRESELTGADYRGALAIYGPVHSFRHWEAFQLPILKIDSGFSFQGIPYARRNDGLAFLSPARNVYTGNSPAVLWQLQRTFTSYYFEYLIIRDGSLSRVRIPGKPEIDLDEIRRVNYTAIPSGFYRLYVSKSLHYAFDADTIVTSICRIMHLPLPTFTIPAYVHSDPNAARLFSNFFFMTGCDVLADSVKFGTAQFGSIHTVGMDEGLLRHESFHLLWDGLVGSSGGNSFFEEGVESYYEFLFYPMNYAKALAVAKRHTDIDLTNLVLRGSSQDFWGGPAENGWPVAYSISGLFVKFLVDRWGLEAFKRWYVIPRKETAFTIVYGRTCAEVIEAYAAWIRSSPESGEK